MKRILTSLFIFLFTVSIFVINIIRQHYIAANITAIFVAGDLFFLIFYIIIYIKQKRNLKKHEY